MELNARRLQVLRAVAVGSGVLGAARLLHLTPSAVSQQLAQLEREVGLVLIDRSRRRVELTEAGRLLAARAERIEHELAEARRDLAALTGRVAGPVIIAAFPTAICHLVVPAMRQLAEVHPEVRPSVLEVEGQPAERELRTGGIDLVISERDAADPAPAEAGIAVQALADDPYRVVCPAAWAVRPRSVPELADVGWVAGPPDSACGQALLRLAGQHRFTPRIAHTCLEFPAVLALVEAGFGAAIVPLLALPDTPGDRMVVTDIHIGGARRLAAAYRSARSGVEPVVAVTVDALIAAAARRGLAPPAVSGDTPD